MVPTNSPTYAGIIARRLQDAHDAMEEARVATLLALDPDAPIPYVLAVCPCGERLEGNACPNDPSVCADCCPCHGEDGLS